MSRDGQPARESQIGDRYSVDCWMAFAGMQHWGEVSIPFGFLFIILLEA